MAGPDPQGMLPPNRLSKGSLRLITADGMSAQRRRGKYAESPGELTGEKKKEKKKTSRLRLEGQDPKRPGILLYNMPGVHQQWESPEALDLIRRRSSISTQHAQALNNMGGASNHPWAPLAEGTGGDHRLSRNRCFPAPPNLWGKAIRMAPEHYIEARMAEKPGGPRLSRRLLLVLPTRLPDGAEDRPLDSTPRAGHKASATVPASSSSSPNSAATSPSATAAGAPRHERKPGGRPSVQTQLQLGRPAATARPASSPTRTGAGQAKVRSRKLVTPPPATPNSPRLLPHRGQPATAEISNRKRERAGPGLFQAPPGSGGRRLMPAGQCGAPRAGIKLVLLKPATCNSTKEGSGAFDRPPIVGPFLASRSHSLPRNSYVGLLTSARRRSRHLKHPQSGRGRRSGLHLPAASE